MFSPPVTTPCTIQCVLVGNTSSGKTTTTNALFAQPLSATSRQRNTLRPRVYVESSAPDDPATIAQRNAAADAIKSMPSLNWLGYLSTTGVYGNTNGAEVTEDSPLEHPLQAYWGIYLSDEVKRKLDQLIEAWIKQSAI